MVEKEFGNSGGFQVQEKVEKDPENPEELWDGRRWEKDTWNSGAFQGQEKLEDTENPGELLDQGKVRRGHQESGKSGDTRNSGVLRDQGKMGEGHPESWRILGPGKGGRRMLGILEHSGIRKKRGHQEFWSTQRSGEGGRILGILENLGIRGRWEKDT